MLKFLLPLLLAFTAAFAADEYELVMDRPSKAGDRMSITGSRRIKQMTEIKAGAQVVKDERLEIEVEYDVEREILAVNEVGKPVHDRLRIVKIAGSYNGGPATHLKPGDLIETKIEATGTTTLVNGVKATAEQMHLGRALPRVKGRSLIKDDEAYGPGRKVKVGDAWPINAAVAAKQAAESGIPGLKPEGIKGSVKLLEVINREGQPLLKVRGKMEFSGAGMPVPQAPPEVKVTEMAGTTENESDFPLDPKMMSPRNDEDSTLRITAAGEVEKDGRKLPIELKADFATRTREQVKPIK